MDISSFMEVEMHEGDSGGEEQAKPVLTYKPPLQTYSCQEYSQSENEFYHLTYERDVSKSRTMKLHCTACDEHIGSAPIEKNNMHEHPVLRTLLCAKCRKFYGDGNFERGEDDTDMFCRWCANGGNLYCCSHCSNTFCSRCIKRNFEPKVIRKIEEDENWKCFVCDPCDIFPLRSLCRALLAHIEKANYLLQNSNNLDSKTIEEKMNLDESQCCPLKRKKRRLTISLPDYEDDDIDDDDENDDLYLPDSCEIQPKKRKSARKSDFTNGHSEEAKRTVDPVNSSAEFDPSDLLIPCEQTMIEGDEILNPENVEPPRDGEVLEESTESSEFTSIGTIIDKETREKIESTEPMGNKTFANFLKVAIANSNNKNIKFTTSSKNAKTKLVAVPMSRVQKAISSNSLKIVKPPMKFLFPNATQRKILPKIMPKPISLGLRPKPQSTPSVINLDDEDEDITEVANASSYNQCNGTQTNKENEKAEESLISIPSLSTDPKTSAQNNKSKTSDTVRNPFAFENSSAMKTKNRDLRFKKMLQLQVPEIENTISELRTKVNKLVQNSNLKPQDGDLLQSAAISTKRFHRIMKKALAELAHINDRVVRDFLHWKKRADVIPGIAMSQEKGTNAQTDGPSDNNSSINVSCTEKGNETEFATSGNENKTDCEVIEIDNCDNRQLTNVGDASKNCAETNKRGNDQENKENQNELNLRPRWTTKSKDDIPLEMTCVRDSESDSSDDEMESTILKATITPLEFANLLDHLSIFKKKVTCSKSVGDDSIAHTQDRGCQVEIEPKRDFEKCIGYSLVNRVKSDELSEEPYTELETSVGKNFDKYQEQYLFYLQHIEDNGIETDDTKGFTTEIDHIPEKTPIDSSTLANYDELCSEISLIGSRTENNTFGDFPEMPPIDYNLPSLLDVSVNDRENNHTSMMTEGHVDEPEILSYYQSPKDMDALLEIVKKIPENLET